MDDIMGPDGLDRRTAMGLLLALGGLAAADSASAGGHVGRRAAAPPVVKKLAPRSDSMPLKASAGSSVWSMGTDSARGATSGRAKMPAPRLSSGPEASVISRRSYSL